MTYTKDAYRGIYNPINPQKYVGDITKIVYRSSYELRFMKWCDLNHNVLQWGSEEVVVPYISPVDNKTHRYFVDFFIKVKNREGMIKKYLIVIYLF
jgi:ABC-type phosphate transport system substrate-binding protein